MRTFYLQISLIALAKLVKNADFLYKNGLVICKFSIRGSEMLEHIYCK